MPVIFRPVLGRRNAKRALKIVRSRLLNDPFYCSLKSKVGRGSPSDSRNRILRRSVHKKHTAYAHYAVRVAQYALRHNLTYPVSDGSAHLDNYSYSKPPQDKLVVLQKKLSRALKIVRRKFRKLSIQSLATAHKHKVPSKRCALAPQDILATIKTWNGLTTPTSEDILALLQNQYPELQITRTQLRRVFPRSGQVCRLLEKEKRLLTFQAYLSAKKGKQHFLDPIHEGYSREELEHMFDSARVTQRLKPHQ